MNFFDEITFDNNMSVRIVTFDIKKSFLVEVIDFIINDECYVDELVFNLKNKLYFDFYVDYHKFIRFNKNMIYILDCDDFRSNGDPIFLNDTNVLIEDIIFAKKFKEKINNGYLINTGIVFTYKEIDVIYGWKSDRLQCYAINYSALIFCEFINLYLGYINEGIIKDINRFLHIYNKIDENTVKVVNNYFRLSKTGNQVIISMVMNDIFRYRTIFLSDIYDRHNFESELLKCELIIKIIILHNLQEISD